MVKIKEYGNSMYLNDTSDKEDLDNNNILELFKQCPIPEDQLLSSLGLFINRQTFSRMLFFDKIYKEYLLDNFGCIMEFGVRWGRNLPILQNLRGMYEPYNYTRKIIGFDTFEGLSETCKNYDGDHKIATKGAFSTTKDYHKYLEKVLEYHETQSPIQHKKKFEILKGDACVTLKKYLKDYPETIISFVFFDMDIYKPTKECLTLILPHLHKGSIIAFDELSYHEMPGETLAFREIFGSDYKIYRDINNPMPSWVIYE